MKMRILGILAVVAVFVTVWPIGWERLFIVAIFLSFYGGASIEVGKAKAGGAA